MEIITIEDMKKLELNILKDVAEFCDQNNIRYFICGGTLLGAVRHGGFIPWDDDIDIMMPRPDYLKFVLQYNGYNPRYKVKSIENDKNYWRTFAKVFDLKTHLQEEVIRVEKQDNGVFIDIFPVDGLPKSRWMQTILFKQQEFLNFLYHGSAWNYTKSFKYEDSKDKLATLKGWIRTVLKFVAISVLYPLSTRKLIKLINDNAMKNSYDKAEEVAAIVDCHYGGARERLPKNAFEERCQFIFENCKFWGTCAYDLYLSNLYGNYMELPPLDKRVTHHDYTAYWKE